MELLNAVWFEGKPTVLTDTDLYDITPERKKPIFRLEILKYEN